jgi:hypothetical protein
LSPLGRALRGDVHRLGQRPPSFGDTTEEYGGPAACLKVTCGAMQGRAASSVLASLPGVRRIGAARGEGT